MGKVSLYRKYRPNNFKNLIGQKHVRETLIAALKEDKLVHAYLFTGPRGTGKTSTARLIAKSLNCLKLKDGFEPCDECEFCMDINSGRLIDLIEIDAASNRGIDEIRELRDKINYSPSRSKFKIYIIDEVHMLTKEAFNALLKTLEEPPEHSYFVLATTEVHKIPATIISRCQRFDFKRIADDDLLERLEYIAKEEDFEVEKEALDIVVDNAEGGVRDAIGLLEQLVVNKKLTKENAENILGSSGRVFVKDFVKALRDSDFVKCFEIVDQQYKKGLDFDIFLHDLLLEFRKNMLGACSNDDFAEVGVFLKFIEIFQFAKENPNPGISQLPIEIAIAKIKINSSDKKKVQIANGPPAEENVPSKIEKVAVKDGKKVASVEPKKTEGLKNGNAEKKRSVSKKNEPAKKEVGTGSSERVHSGITGFDFGQLRGKWREVIASIKKPSLRMSLKNCKIRDAEDGERVILEFDTKFHRDNVMVSENIAMLEKITLGYGVKVKFIDNLVKIEGAKKKKKETFVMPARSKDVKSEANSKPADDAATALKIFGGEMS